MLGRTQPHTSELQSRSEDVRRTTEANRERRGSAPPQSIGYHLEERQSAADNLLRVTADRDAHELRHLAAALLNRNFEVLTHERCMHSLKVGRRPIDLREPELYGVRISRSRA